MVCDSAYEINVHWSNPRSGNTLSLAQDSQDAEQRVTTPTLKHSYAGYCDPNRLFTRSFTELCTSDFYRSTTKSQLCHPGGTFHTFGRHHDVWLVVGDTRCVWNIPINNGFDVKLCRHKLPTNDCSVGSSVTFSKYELHITKFSNWRHVLFYDM